MSSKSQPPGYRELLDASGVSLGFSHTFEAIGGTHSTLRSPLAGHFSELTVNWNPGALGCSRCGTFTASYSAHTQTRELLTPDHQGISNLSAPAFHRWRQAYFEITPVRPLRIKAGKVDGNTEFAVIEAAGDISNSSAGVSPTLFLMPSYPDGSLSVNAFLTSGRGQTVGAGLYRSAGGGAFLVTEVGQLWKGPRPGRASAGLWEHRGGRFEGKTSTKTRGSWLTLEQTLVRRGPSGGLAVFGRYSSADEAVAPASMHTVYGAAWTGIGPRRDDSVGMAFLSLSPAECGYLLQTEKAWEAYYRIAVNRHLVAKVDLQRLQRPGGRMEEPPFTAVSLRLQFRFETAPEEKR